MPVKQIYLDHNATTPLHPEVKIAMQKAMDVFGNPSSMHSFGRDARALVEESREKIASFINAEADEIFFVGSGSEANNTILSIFTCEPSQCANPCNMAHEIITSKIEHPCILEASKCLQNRGTPILFLNVDNYGKIDTAQLEKMISSRTGLVSVMMANNEIGTIQDIKKIADISHKKGALFHTDAVQAVGKIPVDVKKLNIDFLSLSGHKIYGPKGVGAVYVKKGVKFCPLIRGGHQEKGRRAGTENTLGIIALGKAIEMRKVEMDKEEKSLLELKSALKKGIEKSIPDIRFNGHPTDCLPGTLNVTFQGVEGEAILLYLDLEGIAVSTGSACSSGSLDPSHVLLACGIPAEGAHGSIRFSLGRDNTKEEIDYTVTKLTEVIKKTRKMSTAYK
ncbi:MAG: cysteine desulfurase [Candidatus Omnitrophica bacterium]|nr:cysteine desulfurase [Candidatus Omnitrophota bacterium]